jgi:hypothetical protein
MNFCERHGKFFTRYVLFWRAFSPILHIYKICTNHWLWFRFTLKQITSVPWNVFMFRKYCIKHDEFPSNQRFHDVNLYAVRRTDLWEDLPMFRMLAIKSQSKNNLGTLFIGSWTCFNSPTPGSSCVTHCAHVLVLNYRTQEFLSRNILKFLTSSVEVIIDSDVNDQKGKNFVNVYMLWSKWKIKFCVIGNKFVNCKCNLSQDENINHLSINSITFLLSCLRHMNEGLWRVL